MPGQSRSLLQFNQIKQVSKVRWNNIRIIIWLFVIILYPVPVTRTQINSDESAIDRSGIKLSYSNFSVLSHNFRNVVKPHGMNKNLSS